MYSKLSEIPFVSVLDVPDSKALDLVHQVVVAVFVVCENADMLVIAQAEKAGEGAAFGKAYILLQKCYAA